MCNLHEVIEGHAKVVFAELFSKRMKCYNIYSYLKLLPLNIIIVHVCACANLIKGILNVLPNKKFEVHPTTICDVLQLIVASGDYHPASHK